MPTPLWQPATTYAASEVVQPYTWNGSYFTCSTPGTSGNSEPSWNTTQGDTTSDGTAVWTCVGSIGPDYGQLQVGALVAPLPSSPATTNLQAADPALFYALDFWSWVITNYVGAAIVSACSSAGVTAPGGTAIAAAVAQAYPYEPLPEQLENQFQFPLLCAYRKTIDTEWETVGVEADTTALEVLYILPPLNAAQSELILPFLAAIAKILRKKTTDAWDPNYTPPGGNKGDQFDSAEYANLQEVGFGEWRGMRTRTMTRLGSQGFLEAGQAGGVFFPVLRLNAYFVEADQYNPTAGGPLKFGGTDVALGVRASDGTVVPNVVQAETMPAPTVTALSTTSGTFEGGTSTTLIGTGFVAGCLVYFGPSDSPQYAPSVSVTSATEIAIATPAMQGAGAVSVTVVTPTGQSASLASAFTFT